MKQENNQDITESEKISKFFSGMKADQFTLDMIQSQKNIIKEEIKRKKYIGECTNENYRCLTVLSMYEIQCYTAMSNNKKRH